MKFKVGDGEGITIFHVGNKVIAKDTITDKVGVARCNPEDKFCFKIGAEIAFARLMKGDKTFIPDGVFESEETKVTAVRRKAKVGETIKIVGASCSFGEYKNGDILKVSKVSKNTVLANGSHIWHEEYVVLENYKPSEKQKTLDEGKKAIDELKSFLTTSGLSDESAEKVIVAMLLKNIEEGL